MAVMSNQIHMGPGPVFGNDGNPIGTPDKLPVDYDNLNLLGFAQEVMMYGVLTMQQLGAEKFAQIKANSKLARDAQEMANRVDAYISRITTPDGMTPYLPEGVQAFMEKNGILVDGKTIKEFIDGLPVKDKQPKISKGDLQAIKAAIDNFVSRQTDIGQQANLEIQKITTTFNYLIEAIKTLISKVGDLNQGIMNKL
jgi:secreted effector protein SseB